MSSHCIVECEDRACNRCGTHAKSGERIVPATDTPSHFKYSGPGKILCNKDGGCYVEFDKNIEGHDAGGRGKDEHCWWLDRYEMMQFKRERKP
jgi:hypothetical protein